MSTRQSRLVYDQGARPCPRQSYRRSSGKLPDASIADALRRPISVQTARNVREVDELATRGPTRVRIESNDPRRFGLKTANKIGSGNIAGVEHASDSDSDGDRNSNDTDGRVPIDSHSSFATRH